MCERSPVIFVINVPDLVRSVYIPRAQKTEFLLCTQFFRQTCKGKAGTAQFYPHSIPVGCKRHAPGAVALGKGPDTHCTGNWVGLRAELDGSEK